MRMGVLDVGSNTVHLLVVDAHVGAAPIPAQSFKHELRLAEHLRDDGSIDEAAVKGLIKHIGEASAGADDLGCTEILAFATSAIREATGGEEVLARVRKATGIDLQVLSGDDEARLTFLAVRRWFGWSSRRLLVLDIGGGSLELATGIDESPDVAVSLPLGAGRMASQWFRTDPVGKGDLRELRRLARRTIAEAVPAIRKFGRPDHIAATSKTFRSLARIAGAAAAGEGMFVERTLRLEDLQEWTPKLAEMTVRQRAALPGVSAGRAKQVLAGAVVAEAAMDLLDVQEVEICPWALREGVILRTLDRMAIEAERP